MITPLLAAPSEGRERGQARGVRGGTEVCAGVLRRRKRSGALGRECRWRVARLDDCLRVAANTLRKVLVWFVVWKLRAGAVSQEVGHRTVRSERSKAPKEPRSECSTDLQSTLSILATPALGR